MSVATPPFDFEPPSKALRTKVKSNIVVALVGQGIKFVINIGSVAVLARLLSRSDYGLVAMATALSAILAAFRDVGLSSALLQKPKITHDEVSSLFWTNIALGLGVALLSIPGGYLAASMMKDDRLVPIVISFGFIGFIGSFSIQHASIMQRRMEMTEIVRRDTLGQVVGLVVGIAAAYLKFGYWSLVLMQLASTVVTGITMWTFCSWRPMWKFEFRLIKPLLDFGWKVMASNLVNRFSTGIDAVVYGTHFGAEVVGVYNRAQNLLKRPMAQVLSPIMSAVKPAISRAAEDPERLKRVTLELTGLVSLLCCFVVAVISPLSEHIVRILLGPGWLDAAPIFCALAVFGLVEPCASFLSTVIIASGNPGTLLWWKIVSIAIILAGLYCALPWGPVYTAATFAATGLLIRMPVYMYIVCRKINLAYPPMFIAVFNSVIVGAAAGVFGFWIRHLTREAGWGFIPQALAIGSASVTCYLLIALCFPQTRGALVYFRTHALSLRSKGKGKSQLKPA